MGKVQGPLFASLLFVLCLGKFYVISELIQPDLGQLFKITLLWKEYLKGGFVVLGGEKFLFLDLRRLVGRQFGR